MPRAPALFLIAVALAGAPHQALAGHSSASRAPDRPNELVVSAAASVSESLEEIARAFERGCGCRVLLNTGGSNSLARQIVAGAPVDLFISADADQMQAVEMAGRIAPGGPVVLLSNRLVVVAAPARAADLRSPRDLLGPGIARIAAGDPAAVPAGVYARRCLESLGLWSQVRPKIVPGVSVRAALAAVERGDADAAIVYRSDAAISRRVATAFELPETPGLRIVYPAAVLTGAPHENLAREFLEYLRSPGSMSVFARYGFEVPTSGSVSTPPQSRERGFDWPALARVGTFTVVVALAATALMLPPAIVIAWLLARGRFTGKVLVETLVSLPLVLPPVATGLVLLNVLGRRGPLGAMLAAGGIDVVFTWKAVVIAMAVMGFPLAARTARVGFEQVTRRYEQVAETLGAGPLRVFFTISLPLASRDVLAGALLGFSRALGEFGATIVVAGSLPGRTRTVALAMFDAIETGHDAQAGILLAGSAAVAFGAVWMSNRLVRGRA